MSLGALCDREYGFDYDEIRKRKGMAWYPIVTSRNTLEWEPNPHYKTRDIVVRRPGDYSRLGLIPGTSLYQQTIRNLDRFAWVSNPVLAQEVWTDFEP